MSDRRIPGVTIYIYICHMLKRVLKGFFGIVLLSGAFLWCQVTVSNNG